MLLVIPVVVVSKTFTTAETMLNARTLRNWITTALGLVSISLCLAYRFHDFFNLLLRDCRLSPCCVMMNEQQSFNMW